MIVRKIFPLILCQLFAISLQAQTLITGVVKNKRNEPLVANVTVQSKGSLSISSFAATNIRGTFALTYKGKADSIIVTIAGMNVGSHSRTVVNQSGEVNFVIDETPILLKEVAVKPPKITLRRDTINYLVSSFTDQSDRVIGDVLKKMPGIEVSPNGTIAFNGKNINKFYVENLDLLQGRYGIATNNIAAKDVASVQVLENHQPVKALQDKVISNEAAINLVLKDSAKGTWAVTGLAGIGYQPLLWEAELVGMYYAKGKQNMSTYKGNDTGKNIFSEFSTHYDYERVNVSGGSILSIQSPGSPPVPENRYIENQSHAISTNQLIKLNEDLEFTANALFYNDRTDKEGYSRHEEFLTGDSTLIIEERISTVTKTNNAEIALQLNSNASNYYFNEALNLKGSWNEDTGIGNTFTNATGLNESIFQHLLRPSFSADNTMNWIKNIKSNSIKIYFSTGYGQQPQTLTITPANYMGNGTISSLTQNALSKNIASVLRLSYGLRLGDFIMDYSISENVNLKNLNTELQRMNTIGYILPPADSLKNDLWYNTYQTKLEQSYIYKTEKIRANINLPLTYYILTINDCIPNTFNRHNKWIFMPSYSLSYDLSGNWQLSTGGSFGKSYGNMSDAYTGYIMNNYRSLLRNTIEQLSESSSGKASINLRYSNPFDAIFGSIGLNYRLSWRNLLYGYNYQGIMSVKTTIEQPTQSDGYGITLNASKGLDFWSATIRINGGYSESRGELLIQNQIYNYRSQNYNAGATLNLYPHPKLGITYGLVWTQNRSFTVERTERFSPIQGVSQNGKINFFPTNELTISLRGEHQYNSAASKRYAAFADVSITYKKKPFDIELEINNIFNTKQYISAIYSDVSTYYYSYQLRPMSILVRTRFKLK